MKRQTKTAVSITSGCVNLAHRGSVRRSGTLLLLVLMTGTIIGVIGLGALIVQRVQLESSGLQTSAVQARLAAQSATAAGVHQVADVPGWRTTSNPGTWNSNVAIGSGSWSLEAADPTDSSFSDNQTDPVLLHGTGDFGEAYQRNYVLLQPTQTLRSMYQMNLVCQDRLSFDTAFVSSESWLAAGGNITSSGGSTVYADVLAGGSLSSSGMQNRTRAGAVVSSIPTMADFAWLTASGQSVNWWSVPTASPSYTNVIRNDNFSGGVYGWEPSGSGVLTANSSGGSGNGACVQLEYRQSSSDGIAYDITGFVRNGLQTAFSAKVLPLSANAAFEVSICVTTTTGTYDAATWNSWTIWASTWYGNMQTLSTTLTPSWTGRLKQAVLKIRTTGFGTAGTQTFRLDDVSLSLSSAVSGRGLYRKLVSTNANPFGAANQSQGIYVIDCNGHDITLMDCRIAGTLVFLNASRVIVRDAVNWTPAAASLPALVVDGDLELRTQRFCLCERDLNTNFNPYGSPDINGSADSSQNDIYPSAINGLVMATGDILIEGDVLCRGVILSGDDITIRQRLIMEYPAEQLTTPTPATHEYTNHLRPADGVRRGFD